MTAISETRRPIAVPTTAQRVRNWVLNPWGEPRGLVVITWQHGDRTLDTGVDPRHGTDELMRALESRFAVSATERPSA